MHLNTGPVPPRSERSRSEHQIRSADDAHRNTQRDRRATVRHVRPSASSRLLIDDADHFHALVREVSFDRGALLSVSERAARYEVTGDGAALTAKWKAYRVSKNQERRKESIERAAVNLENATRAADVRSAVDAFAASSGWSVELVYGYETGLMALREEAVRCWKDEDKKDPIALLRALDAEAGRVPMPLVARFARRMADALTGARELHGEPVASVLLSTDPDVLEAICANDLRAPSNRWQTEDLFQRGRGSASNRAHKRKLPPHRSRASSSRLRRSRPDTLRHSWSALSGVIENAENRDNCLHAAPLTNRASREGCVTFTGVAPPPQEVLSALGCKLEVMEATPDHEVTIELRHVVESFGKRKTESFGPNVGADEIVREFVRRIEELLRTDNALRSNGSSRTVPPTAAMRSPRSSSTLYRSIHLEQSSAKPTPTRSGTNTESMSKPSAGTDGTTQPPMRSKVAARSSPVATFRPTLSPRRSRKFGVAPLVYVVLTSPRKRLRCCPSNVTLTCLKRGIDLRVGPDEKVRLVLESRAWNGASGPAVDTYGFERALENEVLRFFEIHSQTNAIGRSRGLAATAELPALVLVLAGRPWPGQHVDAVIDLRAAWEGLGCSGELTAVSARQTALDARNAHRQSWIDEIDEVLSPEIQRLSRPLSPPIAKQLLFTAGVKTPSKRALENTSLGSTGHFCRMTDLSAAYDELIDVLEAVRGATTTAPRSIKGLYRTWCGRCRLRRSVPDSRVQLSTFGGFSELCGLLSRPWMRGP